MAEIGKTINVPVKFELDPINVQPLIDALTGMQNAFAEMAKDMNGPLKRLNEIALQSLPSVHCDQALPHAAHRWHPEVDGEFQPSRCDGRYLDA